jgi:hypothetical protein
MVFNPIDKCMEQKTDESGQGVWEFDSNGANKALELMGKHVAMFTEKKVVDTNLTVGQVFKIGDTEITMG